MSKTSVIVTVVIILILVCVRLITISISRHVPQEAFTNEFVYNIDNPNDEYTIVPYTTFDQQLVSIGKNRGKCSRLIVVSLIRNCKDSIPCMTCKLAVLSGIFKEVHVYLFENNSTDGTRDYLLPYVGRKGFGGSNVILHLVNPLTHKLNEPTCQSDNQLLVNDQRGGSLEGVGFNRIQRMVTLRNSVLDFIYKVKHEKNDILLMTDMDIIGRIFPTGICETLGYLTKFNNLGFVSFRGYTNRKMYFDPYSYSPIEDSSIISSVSSTFGKIPSNHGLFKVGSAHSGGVFANLPIREDLRYKLEKSPLGVYLCEHVTMMREMENNVINTNMAFIVKDHV